MKKIFTILSIFSLSATSFTQVIFQSDLSSWSAGEPTDWMGSKTNLTTAVVQVPFGSSYGGSDVQIANATASHQRFTTQPLSVTDGQTYEIKFWVKGQGEIRTGLFDDHMPTSSAGYQYNSYYTINSATATEYTQTITALGTNANAEFILSIRNTVGPGHLVIDSVSITATVTPPANVVSIYDIQYTTDGSGDSPEAGNVVTTYGIVTGVIAFGTDEDRFFIQDGNGAWNGLYVYTNTFPVALGDSVEVTGTVTEYFGLTELTSVSDVTIINSGNAQPTAVEINTGDAAQEQYECVLVKVTDAICSVADDGFGGFTINDGSGLRIVDDQVIDTYPVPPVVGNGYEVTGVTFLSFSIVKLLPRIGADIVVTGFAGVEENNEFTIYPNPANSVVVLNVQPDAVVRIYSTTGALVYEAIGETTIDVSNFEAGIYQVTVLQNETTSVQKLSVQ